MKTIKVENVTQALHDLERILGFPLSGYVPGTTGQCGFYVLRRFAKTACLLRTSYGVRLLNEKMYACKGGWLLCGPFAHSYSDEKMCTCKEGGWLVEGCRTDVQNHSTHTQQPCARGTSSMAGSLPST